MSGASSMPSDINSKLSIVRNSMHSLNNDCLESIFVYLSLPEQIRFARICKRFTDGFIEFSKRPYRVCDLYKISQMSLSDVYWFFRLAGENIQKITHEKDFVENSRIIEWIGTYCLQLRDLNLSNCYLTDESIKYLQNLNNLEILSIADNRELTGKYLKGLVHLTDLNLCGCLHIEQQYLIKVFKTLSKLRKLDIRGCTAISPELFSTMATHCVELEGLKMSSPRFMFECVASLPRLKEFILLDRILRSSPRTRLLEELAALKSNQLETLEIYTRATLLDGNITLISQLRSLKKLIIDFNTTLNDKALNRIGNLKQLEILSIKGCKSMSAAGILNLLRACPRLYSINMQYCGNIETKFVLDVIPILHDESAERKKPLKLFVFETSIQKEELAKNALYLEAVEKSLIEIEFNTTKTIVVDGIYLNYWRGLLLSDNAAEDRPSIESALFGEEPMLGN